MQWVGMEKFTHRFHSVLALPSLSLVALYLSWNTLRLWMPDGVSSGFYLNVWTFFLLIRKFNRWDIRKHLRLSAYLLIGRQTRTDRGKVDNHGNHEDDCSKMSRNTHIPVRIPARCTWGTYYLCVDGTFRWYWWWMAPVRKIAHVTTTQSC